MAKAGFTKDNTNPPPPNEETLPGEGLPRRLVTCEMGKKKAAG